MYICSDVGKFSRPYFTTLLLRKNGNLLFVNLIVGDYLASFVDVANNNVLVVKF